MKNNKIILISVIGFLVIVLLWFLFFSSSQPGDDIFSQIGMSKNKIASLYSSAEQVSDNADDGLEYSLESEDMKCSWNFSFTEDQAGNIIYTINFKGESEIANQNFANKLEKIKNMLIENDFVPTDDTREGPGYKVESFNNTKVSRFVMLSSISTKENSFISVNLMDRGILFKGQL